MRADLLALMNQNPSLAIVDRDFLHLFGSWFNRGFLVLRRIDWSSPAALLEKIIRYEAVHEIGDWDELRRRIDPADRRCYAFFHPRLVDEPLIFVEVALTLTLPAAIAPLLAEKRAHLSPNKARAAAFYSISNCQQGLAGVNFGNFLIKQVVEEIRRELPAIETFITLSPVPGFRAWLETTEDPSIAPLKTAALSLAAEDDWRTAPEVAARLRAALELLAAHYFLKARRPDGRVIDPVARFHLGNGASLERIDWQGDLSPKGLAEFDGIMVNYLYDLDEIERNHEAFVNRGQIAASSAVKKLLPAAPSRLRAALPGALTSNALRRPPARATLSRLRFLPDAIRFKCAQRLAGGEDAMYAAIRQFKAKPGSADALAERIKGAVPIISEVSGFMGYYVIYAPDDTVTAISVFNTVAEAQESNRRALAWIEDNLGPLVVGAASATAGPVIVHSLP